AEGGASSRGRGRIKEVMIDTQNRGRVLFVVMTNRPDKLDVDLKRAGRLDRKIPFLYPQTVDEIVGILQAQFKKQKVKTEVQFPRDNKILEKVLGYSNADFEAMVILATDYAAERGPEAPI